MTIDHSDQDAEHRVDLTNCDREPIHQLGRVQSYGALIAVSSDWIIQHASMNLHEILGVQHEDALGRPLNEIIVAEGFTRIRDNLRAVENPQGAARLFGVVMRESGKTFDVSVHQSGSHLIVEFEPKLSTRGRDVLSEVYPQIAALRRNRDLHLLARDAARGLQELTGFDSVMVYQFQPDHSGKVIAEQRLDGQVKYDGMMFPASDIPVQARTLYKRSLLRLIADVNDAGSRITPGRGLDGTPLDLSLAVTRSVSPIHIEYLRNMGVEASMSVSIMKDGELWGLFACHHNSPRYIDYERRTAVEMFAHMFSYELGRFEDGQRKTVEQDTSRLHALLMGHMADGRALADSLLAASDEIKSVIPHDGLVLFEDENFHATGSVPTEEEFLSIARFLDRSIGASVFSTDCLSKLHEPAGDYADRVAGLMAIPISKRPRDYLVLTRRQVEETVSWAGDPSKPVTVGPNGARLTPRKSFEVWRETVWRRSAPWAPQEVHAADLLRVILLEVFLKVTDAANLERKRAHEQQQLLISELNHRVRNILNLMRGLVAQSRSSARTLEEFTANLDGRIHSLARAHDQLTLDQWEPASLHALITFEFAAYADSKSERMTLEGPDAMITPNAYTTLALVLHEMVTNSIKYGALCDGAGRVSVKLTAERSGGLLICWTERGGPPVMPPKRRGFGSTIIETSIPHELKGDAEISYKVTGVEAKFRLPAKVISQIVFADDQAGKDQTSPASSTDSREFRLTGQGLVLEDTLIIAMDAAGMLEDLGASDVKLVASVEAALAWLETNTPAFALLDVNLGEEQSVPVAEKLHARGVPFLLATGYGEAPELVEAYPPCILLQKPFSLSTLTDALSRVLAAQV
ncbi:HWE histidine kinase domain-containing protein [Roseibium marinum]|uniref:histidine kinase n=1 Tax=Roseibium marinum TaxID=281252 RepID=A0A2S3UTD7_9HYPH|nr:HWE histidine kinase domain-containing protein [Roseibium marinum]POF30982.1 light-regulated signal transduction histidine kinase (bacteriophytochrome) [Roseibium marinum]